MGGSLIMVVGSLIQGFAQDRKTKVPSVLMNSADHSQLACISSLECCLDSVSFSVSFRAPP